jgi:Alpha/beta hydrolase domain
MRIYETLSSALLAAVGMMASVGAAHANPSIITSVDITRILPVGSYGGLTYRYVEGVIHGEVSAEERVVGLRELAAGRTAVPYHVIFHVVAPEAVSEADTIVVEAPNRGRSIFPGLIGVAKGPTAAEPVANAIGDGFLLSHRISIAAVQWQTGFTAGVPKSAQGIGEVVVRDFGRWLGGAFRSGASPLPIFRHRILAGVSQAAWFVNSFIAEGFNADPETGRGVYQGAFTRNGNGVVLAINRFAEEREQFPYARADLAPLLPAELLSRPASDPELVDVISLTDFYRVRASIFARAPTVRRLHRYATAAPHASGAAALPEVVFGTMKCNGGAPISLSKVRDALYLRPLILGLSASISEAQPDKRALPADAPFALEPVSAELEGVNRLDGTPLWTPKAAPNGMPVGGIPMLESALPLGLPRPIALPPAEIASINDTCGNFSGWETFSVDELTRRYGGRANTLEQARQKAAQLVASGYLLEEDEAAAIQDIEAHLPETFR